MYLGNLMIYNYHRQFQAKKFFWLDIFHLFPGIMLIVTSDHKPLTGILSDSPTGKRLKQIVNNIAF